MSQDIDFKDLTRFIREHPIYPVDIEGVPDAS